MHLSVIISIVKYIHRLENASDGLLKDFYILSKYEGCSKRIAFFYLETSNFKLAQNGSFHAIEELSVVRNAKLRPM